MPLKSAVATCVLSQRWRTLWTNLSDIKLLDPYGLSAPMLLNLANNVLPKLTSPIISNLSVQLNSYFSVSHINPWFDWLCGRKNDVAKLRIINWMVFPLWDFQMSSLVVVEIKPLILDESFDDALFHLPNLKKFCATPICCSSPRVLENLVNCAPLLEDFIVDIPAFDIRDYHTFNLSSQSLKRLHMFFGPPMRVVINAPNLDNLLVQIVKQGLYDISFAHCPTSLRTCSLRFWDEHGFDNQDIFMPSNFFNVISGVRSLATFDSNPTPQVAAITFRRVTRFNFVVFEDLSGLALLQQCPLVETLTFDFTDEVFMATKHSWSFPDFVPQCLVTCVKRIEILADLSQQNLEIMVLDLLNYLLLNAKALEVLKITSTTPPIKGKVNRKRDDELLINELLKVPRSSPHSRIEFYSIYDRGLRGDINSIKLDKLT